MERQKVIQEKGGEQNQEKTTSGTRTPAPEGLMPKGYMSNLCPQGFICRFLFNELHEHQTKVRSRKVIDRSEIVY